MVSISKGINRQFTSEKQQNTNILNVKSLAHSPSFSYYKVGGFGPFGSWGVRKGCDGAMVYVVRVIVRRRWMQEVVGAGSRSGNGGGCGGWW